MEDGIGLLNICQKVGAAKIDEETGLPSPDCLYSLLIRTLEITQNDVARLAQYGTSEQAIIYIMKKIEPDVQAEDCLFHTTAITLRLIIQECICINESATKRRVDDAGNDSFAPTSVVSQKISSYQQQYGALLLESQKPGPRIWKTVLRRKTRDSLEFIPWEEWISLEEHREMNLSRAKKKN